MARSRSEHLPEFARVMRELRGRRTCADGRPLTQARAAQLTGLSSYRLFEEGNRSPSAFALAQIVRGLCLDEKERYSLYAAAGIPTWSASCEEGIAGALELAPAVNGFTHPCYVTAPWGQIVAVNAAAGRWLSERFVDEDLPPVERNSWVYLFSDEGLRRRAVPPKPDEGWVGLEAAWPGPEMSNDEYLDRFMATMKAVHLRHLDHPYCGPRFDELFEFMRKLSPRFHDRWDSTTGVERDRAVTWWTIYPRWNDEPEFRPDDMAEYDVRREVVYRVPCLVVNPWALQFADFKLVQVLTDRAIEEKWTAWRWRKE